MQSTGERPNRWLHVRLPRPFSAAEAAAFRADAHVFRRHVEAALEVWEDLGYGHDAPTYVFFPSELSSDGRVATLPLGGTWTLASRAAFETGSAWILWQHLPSAVQAEAEEGLTEEHAGVAETHWRPARRSELPHAASHPSQLTDGHEHPSTLDAVKRALWWVSGIFPPA